MFRRPPAHALLRNGLFQRLKPLELCGTLGTAGEMLFELERMRGIELAVHVGMQQFVGFFASHLCICGAAAFEMACSDSARSRRPRARRDITVPIGTSVMRAMSL